MILVLILNLLIRFYYTYAAVPKKVPPENSGYKQLIAVMRIH